MTTEDIEFDQKHIWHPYTSLSKPLPCYYVDSCHGCKIKLHDGKELVDGMSSWWCVIHGYNNPELNEAAQNQIAKMSHVMFGGITHGPAIGLVRKLIEMTAPELDCCFLADSGSVAVEVALKMAIQYCYSLGLTKKKRFLTINYGYHGDTFGAMSVCDPVNSMHQMYTGYLNANIFVSSPKCGFYDDWDEHYVDEFALAIKDHQDEVAAVILEPIVQGAGGMKFYHPQFLRRVRELCTKYGVLLILDEIATGFGRTGKLFAHEHTATATQSPIVPDIVCLGKGLTGGFMTLSCTMCTREVANTVCNGEAQCFMHGPTFMANPLACAVATKSLEIINRGTWKNQVAQIESQLREGLMPLAENEIVADVRVLGAIGVVELTKPVDMGWFQAQFVRRGAWIRPFNRLVYLMPPYVITHGELQLLIDAMVEVVGAFSTVK